MARELTSDTRWTVPILIEVVNGANVVKTTTSDVVTARGVSAGHDPG